MIAFLAGLGLTIGFFILFFGGLIMFSNLIALLRAALNKGLGGLGKVFWIILCLILPGSGLFYFAFVDKNPILKLTGWVCIVSVAIAALLGGEATRQGWEYLKDGSGFSMTCRDGVNCAYKEQKPPVGNPAPPPHSGHSGDDNSLSL